MTTEPTSGYYGSAGKVTREITSLAPSDAYRAEMSVRRIDLQHVSEDLARVPTRRGWIPTVASAALGVAATALFAGIAAATSTRTASFTIRVVYFGLSGVGLVVSLLLYAIDRTDVNREQVAVGDVKRRLDKLVEMFDEVKPLDE